MFTELQLKHSRDSTYEKHRTETAPQYNNVSLFPSQRESSLKIPILICIFLHSQRQLIILINSSVMIKTQMQIDKNPKTEKKNSQHYPFAHTAKLAGLEFISRRSLKAKHEELTFKINHLFINLLGRKAPNFLQFFFSFRHHHYRRRGRPSRFDGYLKTWKADLDAGEAGFRD